MKSICSIKSAKTISEIALNADSIDAKKEALVNLVSNNNESIEDSLLLFVMSDNNPDPMEADNITEAYLGDAMVSLRKSMEEAFGNIDAMTQQATDGKFDTFNSFKYSVDKDINIAAPKIATPIPGANVSTFFTDMTSLDSEAKVAEESKSIEVKSIESELTVISESNDALMKKKVELAERVKGIKSGTSDIWGEFLQVYFPGMTSNGMKFNEFVKQEILDIIISFSDTDGGFTADINSKLNEIKGSILERKTEAKNDKSARYLDEDTNGDSLVDLKAKLKANPALENRYFLEVLSNEFDFILENVIKIAKRSYNPKINAMVGRPGDSVEIQLSSTLDSGERVVISLNKNAIDVHATVTVSDRGDLSVGYSLETVEMDSHDFFGSGKRDMDTIYHVVNDNEYYIMSEFGEYVNVSPVPVYVINSNNKRNSSFTETNDATNTLDQGTKFINHFMSLVRSVKSIDGNLKYGDRMGIAEFYELAAHMGPIKPDSDDIIARLTEISKAGNVKMANIARSLLMHIYNTFPTSVEGNNVYSLSMMRAKSNTDIMHAFTSALISKRQDKYIESKNGKLLFTATATLEHSEYVLNDSLALHMSNNGYTKKSTVLQIKVNGKKITLIKNSNESKELNDITTMEDARAYMDSLGMATLGNIMAKYIIDNKPSDEVDDTFIIHFKSIIRTAAANIDTTTRRATEEARDRYVDYEITKDYKDHADFMQVKPSELMKAEDIAFLLPMFSPDVMGSINVGGSKRAAAGLPNRNGYIDNQIKEYEAAFIKNNRRVGFIPVLSDTVIPAAEFKGYFTKTPITKNGKPLKVSEWGIGKRLEFEMLNGYIHYPARKKSFGKRFLTQALGYADKSNAHMMDMELKDFNIFASDSTELVEDTYVKYQIEKYEGLQRIMIEEFKLFVGGNYYVLLDAIEAQKTPENGKEIKKRTDALERLRDMLIDTNFDNMRGDMTRDINKELEIVKLDKKLITHSQSKLEFKADVISLPNASHIYLKPHMGVRAEIYKRRGKAEFNAAFKRFKEILAKENVDVDVIHAAFLVEAEKSANVGSVTGKDNMLKAMFMGSSVYGHSMKVLTMGDESAFPGEYNNAHKTINDYYADIDSGKTNGLEEVDSMVKKQSKRGQSNTSNGTRYEQATSYEGLIEEAIDDNIIKHVRIDIDENDDSNYSFPNLESKTLGELAGMGILVRGSKGEFMKQSEEGGFSFKVNVGNSIVTLSTDSLPEEFSLEYEIMNLVASSIQEGANRDEGGFIAISKLDRAGKSSEYSGRLEIEKLEGMMSPESVDGVPKKIVLPDVVPSILVTDPVSHINIVNQMDVKQDNSDGVQFIHPLLYLIMDYARGKEFGAFHTGGYEALKTLTTSFNYKRFRQQLQKKSNQMPFSFEQMANLGSVELWNAFKSMNTAVPFKKPWMVVDGEKVRFENLQALYEHFLKESKGEDEGIWEKVLNVLANNPVNLNSFVGYITFSSAQKNGSHSFNDYDSLFSNSSNHSEGLNLYNTKHEYNYELLSKEHGFDITEESTLSLLTQLVGSISAGGNTVKESYNLQNSMASLAEVHRHALSNEFANIAIDMQEEEDGSQLYNGVIQRMQSGDIDPAGLSDEQVEIYNKVIRNGLTQMAEMAFSETADSALIKKIIQDSGLSLDSPAVQKKVMATLRAGLFKQTVKPRMGGFQAVVTTQHRSAKLFKHRNSRLVRGEYIKANLGKSPDPYARIEHFEGGDPVGKEIMRKYVLPLDIVHRRPLDEGGQWVPVREFDVDMSDPNYEYKVVVTPDINEEINDNITALDEVESGDLIVYTDAKGNSDTTYMWHLMDNYSIEDIQDMVDAGNLNHYTEEKYNLKWYQYTNGEGSSIESTKAFRDYYSLMKDDNLKGDAMKKAMRKAKTILYQELARKASGKDVWEITLPEVIVPAYMSKAFGFDPSVTSLNDIIGYDGNRDSKLLKAKEFFRGTMESGRDKRSFKRLDGESDFNKTKQAFLNRYAKEGSDYLLDIIKEMEANTIGNVSEESRAIINNILANAESKFINNKAESFLKSIDLNASRTPGQSMQSGFNATVVAFLGAQGNMIMAPTEHLVTTGGDFDIDLLNILTVTLMKDGILLDTSRFFDSKGKFDKEALLEEFKETNEKKLNGLKDYIVEYNEGVDDLVAQLVADTTFSEEKRAELIERAEERRITSEKEAVMKANLSKAMLKMYDHYISNTMRDSIQSAFNNVTSAVEINTAMNFTIMKALVNIAEELSDDGGADFSKYDGESFYFNLISEEEALQGKDGISVYATAIKINSTLQGARVIWDAKYKNELATADIGFNIIEADDVKDGVEATLVSYFTGSSSIKLNTLNDRSDTAKFSHRPLTKGKGTKYILHTSNPKVLIVGQGFDMDKDSIEKAKRDAEAAGHDMLIIKGYVEGKHITNIVIPFNNRSQIEEHKTSALDINPFRFEHSLTYTNANTRESRTVARTTFADLDTNALRAYAVNSELNEIITANDGIELTRPELAKITTALVDTAADMIKEVGKASIKIIAINDALGINLKVKDGATDAEVIEVVKRYFKSEARVKDAYYFILGKDSSTDTQSQFMSAAVDNANELLLSKIRANSLTNSIITTMMILGYAPDVIVEFLHDPNMKLIIQAMKDKRMAFESTRISKEFLKGIEGIDVESPFIKSLLSLGDVSSEVFNLLAVKGLNENFKTDQYLMDAIRDKVTYKALYKSIINDSILGVSHPDTVNSPGKLILNPDMIIFLHAQTAALYVNVYEVENTIIPAVSNVAKAIRDFADGETNDDAYKNIDNYMADMQVISFIEKNELTGNVLDYDGGIVPLELGDKTSKEEFVKKFKEYFLVTVEKINELNNEQEDATEGEHNNKLFTYFSSVNSYNSDQAIINIPILNAANPDPVEIAMIREGIQELKLSTGNDALDALNLELYKNLMVYSLIVNSGKIQKNSMVEMFPEISLELSAFLNTLTPADYEKFNISNKYGKRLVTGGLKNKVDTTTEIQRELNRQRKYRAQNHADSERYEYIEPVEVDSAFDVANDNNDQEDAREEYTDENGNTQTRYIKKRGVVETPNTLLIGAIYDTAYGPVLGVKDNYPSLIITKTGMKEAGLRDLNPIDTPILGIPVELTSSIIKSGHTIGMKTSYGSNGRVLALMEVGTRFDMYLVSDGESFYKVPGLLIMKEDPDIYLDGNVISKVSSYNRVERGKFDEIIQVLQVDLKSLINPVSTKEFKPTKSVLAIHNSTEDLALLSKEEKTDLMLLNTNTMAVITSPEWGQKNTQSPLYEGILMDKRIDKISPSNINMDKKAFLIPSAMAETDEYNDLNMSTIYSTKIIYDTILNRMNMLKVGESVKFSGAYSTGAVTSNSTFMIGGAMSMDAFLKKHYSLDRLPPGKKYSFEGFSIEVVDEMADSMEFNARSYIITKSSNDIPLKVTLNGKTTNVKIKRDAAINVASIQNPASVDISLFFHMLETGLITNIPYQAGAVSGSFRKGDLKPARYLIMAKGKVYAKIEQEIGRGDEKTIEKKYYRLEAVKGIKNPTISGSKIKVSSSMMEDIQKGLSNRSMKNPGCA